MRSRRFDGQVVVITGASSGVGRACAREFARRGAKLALLARNPDALGAAAAEVTAAGSTALVCEVDVSDADAVEQAASVVEGRWGRIDVWVNCAMATVFAPIEQTTSDEFRRVTETTYLGYVYGTQSALRRMRPADSGTIVQIGSALAFRSIPLQSAYCASKAAIRAFSDALRTELLHDRSRVAVVQVHLPAVNTPQSLRQRNKMPNQQRPVPPLFSPESIAEMVVWAALRRPRQVLVSGRTRLVVWTQKVLPGLLDRYVAHTAWDEQFIDARNDQRGDILFDTLPGDPGAHGPYRDQERGADLLMRLRRHTFVATFVPAGAPAGVLWRTGRRR